MNSVADGNRFGFHALFLYSGVSALHSFHEHGHPPLTPPWRGTQQDVQGGGPNRNSKEGRESVRSPPGRGQGWVYPEAGRGKSARQINLLPYVGSIVYDVVMSLRIYLDVCCFNRPFDDCRQDRIRLESEAVKAIVQRIERGLWEGVLSPVILFEVSKMSDKDRAIEVGLMVTKMRATVDLTNAIHKRARYLEELGFGGIDALHLACAESSKADVFLTTDDRLRKRAARSQQIIEIEVENPLRWFEREVQK